LRLDSAQSRSTTTQQQAFDGVGWFLTSYPSILSIERQASKVWRRLRLDLDEDMMVGVLSGQGERVDDYRASEGSWEAKPSYNGVYDSSEPGIEMVKDG
jgi:hypothetical protein